MGKLRRKVGNTENIPELGGNEEYMEKLGETWEAQTPSSTVKSDCLGVWSTLASSTSFSEVPGALPVVLETSSDMLINITVRSPHRIRSSRLAACGPESKGGWGCVGGNLDGPLAKHDRSIEAQRALCRGMPAFVLYSTHVPHTW